MKPEHRSLQMKELSESPWKNTIGLSGPVLVIFLLGMPLLLKFNSSELQDKLPRSFRQVLLHLQRIPNMQISWTDFKTFVNARSLSIQWQDTGTYYHLEATDGLIYRTCYLNKGASDTTDLLDFENNYKSLGNKPLSAQSHPFSSKVLPNGKKLYKRETGIQTAVVQGSNTITYTVTYPWVKITGMERIN